MKVMSCFNRSMGLSMVVCKVKNIEIFLFLKIFLYFIKIFSGKCCRIE